MIIELLEKMFSWSSSNKSGKQAKRRLKLIIAHDRIGLNTETLEAMRREVLEVVSRYVEIDPEETELSLESDQRMTVLIANLPIRGVKRFSKISTSE